MKHVTERLVDMGKIAICQCLQVNGTCLSLMLVLLGCGMPDAQQNAVAAPMGASANSNRLIPVATTEGLVWMDQKQYRERTERMGHLPTMSRSYIFGRTIPMPKTDKFGKIHLSDEPPTPPNSNQSPQRGVKAGEHRSTPRPNKKRATKQPDRKHAP